MTVVCGERMSPQQNTPLGSRYIFLRRHFETNTTGYLHSHFVWLRLSISSIAKFTFVCFGGSRLAGSFCDGLQ